MHATFKLGTHVADSAPVRGADEQTIREDLETLQIKIQRLRVEYDQFFMGNARREPSQLRGEVQKMITRYAAEPPRNTQLKFKLNALVARFQALRALWGRTLREIEAGTYKGHRFKADLRDRERGVAPASTAPEPSAAGTDAAPRKSMDRLLDAIMSARQRTGETGSNGDRERLEQIVRKQTEQIRAKHPGSKVKFRVVIEDNKAKLKASLG